MKFRILFLLTMPLLLTGCASIVDGGPKAVHINSKPEGAKVTIFNKAGQEVASETTPATVKLKRSVSFSQEEDYKVVFAMDGYYPHEAHVKTAINAGQTVSWQWDAAVQHSVTSDVSGAFDSGIQTGPTFTKTFAGPGVFPYHCQLHGVSGGIGMAGTITVM